MDGLFFVQHIAVRCLLAWLRHMEENQIFILFYCRDCQKLGHSTTFKLRHRSNGPDPSHFEKEGVGNLEQINDLPVKSLRVCGGFSE